ncbi:MAG: right-handed parallel beta-helix repeat-containing protein [Proteobacteria bacterium]|nr:right-handed parallel beta-helix repeat-containing protein [Pseudomonadota bacterium]
MRAHLVLLGSIAVVLAGCNGEGGEDTGTGPSYPTGCISTSSGGSFAFLADAVLASRDEDTISLCPSAVEESVEIVGKVLTIQGTPQTTWEPPVNEPALILTEGADVTLMDLTVLTTRNGVETDSSTLTLTDVVFDQPGNYAVEGDQSTVNFTDVIVTTPGWGAVALSGEDTVFSATGLEVNGSTGNAVTLSQGASGEIVNSVIATSVCTNDGTNCLAQDGWAVEISDGGTLTLSGNELTDNFVGGVRVESATLDSAGDVLTGNFIGMWLENATAALDNTDVTGTMQYGILGMTVDLDLTDVELSADPFISAFEELDVDSDNDGVVDENGTLDGTYGLVGFDAHVVGDGVEITGHNGGGVYLSTRLDTEVSMELANSLIDDNAGWGIFSQLGDLTFTDVTISNTRNYDPFCIVEGTGDARCNGGLWAFLSDVTWTGGAITDNESMGMIGIQNNQVLSGVTIHNNRDVGIRGASNALTLSASTVSGVGGSGVSLSGGAVASIDNVDFQDRSWSDLYTFSDGSTYESFYAANDVFASDTTLTISNSRFRDGERGIYAASGSTLTLEDSTFTRYNRNVVQLSSSDGSIARTTFDDVGAYSWYCTSSTLAAQGSTFTGIRPYATMQIDTDTDGTAVTTERTSSAPTLYGSNCDVDLSDVTFTDVDERALSVTNGSIQLDGVHVNGSGTSASSTTAALQMTWSSGAPDALINDVSVTGVLNGDAIRVAGTSSTTSGSVRMTGLDLGADDGQGHSGIAEAGVRATFLPDVRLSGLAIETTASSGLAFSQSGVTVDGTAFGSTGVIDGAGAHGIEASGGTLSLTNLTVSVPTEDGIHVVGTSLATTGVTVTGATEAGVHIDGGAAHSLTTTAITGAGTYGLECLSAPQFSECATDLTVDGSLGVHLACDDCASLAGL